jgi:hypothetical protein
MFCNFLDLLNNFFAIFDFSLAYLVSATLQRILSDILTLKISEESDQLQLIFGYFLWLTTRCVPVPERVTKMVISTGSFEKNGNG